MKTTKNVARAGDLLSLMMLGVFGLVGVFTFGSLLILSLAMP